MKAFVTAIIPFALALNFALAQARPNFVVILTDDHRFDALGIAGNKILKTPALDELASSGIRFTNAYVTTSICMVSRASILSGQYMSRHRIRDFNTSFSAGALAQTYPLVLRTNGYKTGFIGKYGVGHPKDQPVGEYDYWGAIMQHQPDYEMKDRNGQPIHNTDFCTAEAIRFLEQHGTGGPFCLSISYKAPHAQDSDPRQFIVAPTYKELYGNATNLAPEKARRRYLDQLPPFLRSDSSFARQRWKLRFDTPEKFEESIRNYYRLISHVDASVAEIRKKLKELNLTGNTVIIFLGDNGFFFGEYGLADKWYPFEESIRIPMIVYDPRSEKSLQGKVVDRIALNIDVAPTILQLAGLPRPEGYQGESLVDIATDKSLGREHFYYEHDFMGSPAIPVSRAVISGKGLKFVQYPEHGFEALYDLRSKDGESKNLIHKYPKRAAEMRTMLSSLAEHVR